MKILKKNVSFDLLGMLIAEDILNSQGFLIIPEGTVLTKHFIDTLLHLNNIEIKVYEQKDPQIIDNLRPNQTILNLNEEYILKIKNLHKSHLNQLKNVMQELNAGKQINNKSINEITDYMNDNEDVVLCVNKIRNMDENTYTHSLNVGLLSMLISKWLKFNIKYQQIVFQAGLLHDIGKVELPINLIHNTDDLTKEEWNLIKKHPMYGLNMLKDMKSLPKGVLEGIIMHHERIDGTGYPMGLKDKEISIIAKIISVADVYDAMMAKRSYKDKINPFDVFKYFEEDSQGIFDVDIVKTFLHHVPNYYLGERVRLSTGEVGEVSVINDHCFHSPIIKVDENRFIDLYSQKDVRIIEYIPTI